MSPTCYHHLEKHSILNSTVTDFWNGVLMDRNIKAMESIAEALVVVSNVDFPKGRTVLTSSRP